MSDNQNRLLVIDDEPAICEFVGEVAEGLGFEARLTTGPDEFHRQVEEFAPSVVVMDLQMPQADGIELLRSMGDNRVEAQVLLVSGMDDRVLSTAKRLGSSMGLQMLGALQKPVLLPDLESMLEKAMLTQRVITEQDLLTALAESQLTVYYQPKASRLDGGRWQVVGTEALVRWKHPRLGLVLPDEFIPLAEEHDIIESLTDFVFRSAIEQCRLWSLAGHQLSVAVNFSPRLLQDLSFPDRISAYAREFELNPAMLTVELTESAAMTDPAKTMDVLTRLRVKNFSLSIDDFGTGFSSLRQLYRMPFNEIKIDRSFVRDVATDQEARTIVETVIYLAHKLGMVACAEGVESWECLDVLAELGCDRVQGYLLSPPVAPARMESVLEGWARQQDSRT